MMGTYFELLQFSVLSAGILTSMECEEKKKKIYTWLMNRVAPQNTEDLTKFTASVLQSTTWKDTEWLQIAMVA